MNDKNDNTETGAEVKTDRRSLPTYEKNPFTEQLLLEVKTKNKTMGFAGSSSLVNNETGEHLGDMAVIGVKKVVDATRFIKIYEQGIKLAFGLKPSALRVFSTLLEAYRVDDRAFGDRLYFNFKIAQNDYEYTYSRQTFAAGITDLLKHNFIAEIKDQGGWFWINPAIFFKGDRLRIVNEYVSESTKEIENKLKNTDPKHLT